MTCLSQNGFRLFCEECSISRSRSKHCKREHLDQLYLAVNNVVKGGELEELGANPKKLLNRREWVDTIIRVAIMRHLMDGDTSDASHALTLLLTDETLGHLPAGVLQDGTAFRNACCYTEPVNAVLLKYEVSLRALFEVYTYDPDSSNLRPDDALNFEAWMEMAIELDLIDSAFSQREATLCFLWSRMWCIDDGTLRARVKMANLVRTRGVPVPIVANKDGCCDGAVSSLSCDFLLRMCVAVV